MLLCLFSCTEKNRVTSFSYSNDKNIDSAIVAQDRAEEFYSQKMYDSAFSRYSDAGTFYEKENDSLRSTYPMLRMAQIQYLKRDYFGSEATATEALPFVIASENITFKRELYNLLGMSHRKLLNYDKALEYYKIATSIAKDSISKCIILNNIGSIYVDKQDYDKGLNIYLKLEKSDTIISNRKELARVYHNLGDIYWLTNNPAALSYFQKAISIRSEIDDSDGLASSYNKIAEYFQDSNNDLAKDYAIKSYAMANWLKIPEYKLDALKVLTSVYNGDDSKKYALQYILLKDSLEKIKLMSKKEFAMIKYDSKKALERVKELEVRNRIESQKSTFKIRLIIIASIFIFLIFILILYINKLKHKKEKMREIYVTETRISKKIHDELANDMFNALTIAENQDFSVPEQQQKFIHSLDNIYNKTRDISRENNTIDTSENFDRILKEMLSDYNTPIISVITVHYDAVNWKTLTEHKKIAVYRVLQEIMVNMKKHSNASNVVIRFATAGKNITIQYTDNGIGLDKKHINYKSGLQNAENRILSISGNISFGTVNEKGLKITITFPE